MVSEQVASAISSASTKVTYGGTAVGFYAFLENIDVVAWLMVFTAIATFFINWYFKRLENKRAMEADRRASELHIAQLAALKKQLDSNITIADKNTTDSKGE